MRRFPAPWTVEALDGGFQIVDANGQALAYVYGAGSCHQASDGIGRLERRGVVLALLVWANL